jgi:hypothetical protein
MSHRLIIAISEVQWVNPLYKTGFFHFMRVSLQFFLLFSQLFVHFKQWDLEKTVETTFFQAWDGPLNDDIYFFLLVSGLHLEFTDYESLLLVEIVGLFGAIEDTNDSFEGTILVYND